MAKKYIRVGGGTGWKDSPSTNTPRNAFNLNIMDKGIDDLDNAIVEQQAQIDALVVYGDSSPAVAQAIAGTGYITLKERLDTEHNEVTSELAAIETQKAPQIQVDNIASQVDSLVLGAVGDGNNPEVIQSRGAFNLLNTRLGHIEKSTGNKIVKYGYKDLSNASYAGNYWQRVVSNGLSILKKGIVTITIKPTQTVVVQHLRLDTGYIYTVVKTNTFTELTDGLVTSLVCDFDILGDGRDFIAISGCYFSTTITDGYAPVATTYNSSATSYTLTQPITKLATSGTMAFYITVSSYEVDRTKLSKNYMSNEGLYGSEYDIDKLINDGTYCLGGVVGQPISGTVFMDVKAITSIVGNAARWIIQKVYPFGDQKYFKIRVVDTNNSANTTVWHTFTDGYDASISGKNGISFGDSITEYGTYPSIMGGLLNANFGNGGIGGSGYAFKSTYDYGIFCIYNILVAMTTGVWTDLDAQAAIINRSGLFSQIAYLKTISLANMDYFTFAYGTNDFGISVPIDNASDKYDLSTMCGGLRKALEYLFTNYPSKRVYVFTPSYRDRMISGDGNNSDIAVNDLGLMLKDYNNAIIDVCNDYHIPVKNMLNDCNVNKQNASYYLNDGLHRTTEGYILLGEQYARFINSN